MMPKPGIRPFEDCSSGQPPVGARSPVRRVEEARRSDTLVKEELSQD